MILREAIVAFVFHDKSLNLKIIGWFLSFLTQNYHINFGKKKKSGFQVAMNTIGTIIITKVNETRSF